MTTTLARPADSRPDDFAAARRAMIDGQLRTSGVNERFVLDRMGAVAREDFVPDQARGIAYMDRAIRLPDGGFLPAPVFHGKMLEEARPRIADRVLIVDGGSGYLAELVRPLVASVEAISPTQGVKGEAKLEAADLLLIDGAIEQLPPELVKLVVEDGRVVTGLVERGVTRLATGRKTGQSLSLLPLAEMGIPRLGQFDRPASWSF
ncbi:MAG: protein-L-isoaspartate O-methyltransferase [Alphaproteobacteria bacterium]|nr:protein-L-isoaspartate O-methyltransferase [Alphaproteobacteria bacterium]